MMNYKMFEILAEVQNPDLLEETRSLSLMTQPKTAANLYNGERKGGAEGERKRRIWNDAETVVSNKRFRE